MTSPLFLGTHHATIDAEGRIQLPAGLRDEVNVHHPDFRLVASYDPDGSLCLRQREDFDAWVEGLCARATDLQRDRATLATVAGHSAPVRSDKQGRIRVPDALLGLVGVERGDSARREVVLVGAFRELRLWSAAGWAARADEARAELGAGLDALGARVPEPAEVASRGGTP